MNALSQLSPRIIFLALFAFCAGLLGYGLYLQHYQGLVPCQLCILQRYAFVTVALAALLAGLSNPRGIATRVWGGLISVLALAGGSVSIRQSWLQHNPPEVTACGPDLDYMVSRFPLSDVLPKLFRGEGDCSKVDWTFLGFSMAEWALVCFVFIFAVGVWQVLRRRAA
ncbi:MAG: putative disulfide oxidoreductase 1 [Rhodocyclales bacterium]|nr:putative disulfide oxidoreductase 1 [Rhodocyclales bacterium]